MWCKFFGWERSHKKCKWEQIKLINAKIRRYISSLNEHKNQNKKLVVISSSDDVTIWREFKSNTVVLFPIGWHVQVSELFLCINVIREVCCKISSCSIVVYMRMYNKYYYFRKAATLEKYVITFADWICYYYWTRSNAIIYSNGLYKNNTHH